MANRKLSDILDEIDEMLDLSMKQLVMTTQSKLSAASPVLSGQLASSWFIGKNAPVNNDLTGKAPWSNWKKGDSSTITVTPYSGSITFGGDWYISSSLPYTFRAAFEPYAGRRGGGDWFTRIEGNLEKDVTRIFERNLRKVK